MKLLANRIVAAFLNNETPADATDALTKDTSPTPLLSGESSSPLRQPKRLVKRTQFGSRRIPKKFRRFLKQSYPMYEDEPEEFTTYLQPKPTKTE
jgi:hypothetical protein